MFNHFNLYNPDIEQEVLKNTDEVSQNLPLISIDGLKKEEINSYFNYRMLWEE